MTEDDKEDKSTGKVVVINRAKPTLIVVNGKTFLSGGRWNDAVMADYIIDKGKNKWLTIGHLASVGCGSNTLDTKRRVRSRLSPLFMELRERDIFLAIVYDDEYAAASKVKIADLSLLEERTIVLARLDRMRRRKELSEAQYDRSIKLLHRKLAC